MEFDDKIKKVGFEVEQFSSKNFNSDEQFKYGLLEEDILFCATKNWVAYVVGETPTTAMQYI